MPRDIDTQNVIILCIDFQEKLLPYIFDFEKIVKNAIIMIKAAKILQVPIIVTEQYPKGIGRTVKPVADALGEYQPVEKVHFSCFQEEDFTSKLQKLGRENLIIMGIESHVCIYQTTREAINAGYHAYILEDAMSSRVRENHEIAVRRMISEGAIPSSVEMTIFELLKKAGTPEFREILKIVK
ncbi:MAG: hydrolase [Candidatus Bathyarchaeia archaeon]